MRMRGAQALDIVETNLSSAANLSSCGVPDRSYRGLTRLQALNRPARAPWCRTVCYKPFRLSAFITLVAPRRFVAPAAEFVLD
mmetsp:Transcript_10728/g.33029  ORF Transcript_10728/g.33029 Transcript_10728/m.33029 type:complete len:83 (+) Transcript_10728:331-579(+)